MSDKYSHREVEYELKKIKVDLGSLVRLEDGVYLEFRDSKLIRKLIKIGFQDQTKP